MATVWVLAIVWTIVISIGLFIRIKIGILQHKLNYECNESRGNYDTINNNGTSRRVYKKQPF